MRNHGKKKEQKNNTSIGKYLLLRIVIITVICIILFVGIYFLFFNKGIIPSGVGLAKTDWLSFLGAYLSFYGTVVVSLTIFLHTNYVAKQSEGKIALERKKHIQPIFSIEISTQNTVMEVHSPFVDMGNKPERPSNVIIKIKNANKYPITNVIVFDKYIISLLEPGKEKSIYCTYSDPTNTYKFYDSIAVVNETDYEKDISGLPTWFNINYDDIDGNEMYQTFELKHFDKTEYYSLEGQHEL